LARKGDGKESKLSFSGNVLIENRHGLVMDTELIEANGTAERDAALLMAERIAGTNRVTLAGDKGYDTHDFVAELRHMNITPHVISSLFSLIMALGLVKTSELFRQDGFADNLTEVASQRAGKSGKLILLVHIGRRPTLVSALRLSQR
jgi:hypothetical protein